MFTELRKSRLVMGEVSPHFSLSDATIFLGLFNASKYVASLEMQLLSQTSEMRLLVVDNHSDDNTWDLIQRWLELFPGQIMLVRNPVNLGATGSLYANADLIETPWFMTLHQDDFYKPNHITSLLEAIQKSTEETICISTEMGSLDSDGNPQPTPPRASWFLPDWEPATIFTSNLRLHNVPFPASAFRADVFFRYRVPWETTAFPDTEWVLGVANLGRFEFIEKETVQYRENPHSESHSINSEEKTIGAALALFRVFGQPSFLNLCEAIALENRDSFADSVTSGIQVRLGEGAAAQLVSMFANQQMASVWGYTEPKTNWKLATSYGKIGATFPMSLLSGLNNYFGNTETPIEIEFQTATNPSSLSTNLNTRTVIFRDLVLKFYGSLPASVRRRVAKSVARAIRKFEIKTEWNFKWK